MIRSFVQRCFLPVLAALAFLSPIPSEAFIQGSYISAPSTLSVPVLPAVSVGPDLPAFGAVSGGKFACWKSCRNDPVSFNDPLGLRDAMWDASGHHIAPVSEVEGVWEKSGRWSDDVIRALNTHNISVVGHNYTAHDQYNLRARVYMEAYIQGSGVDPTRLKGAQAKEFAQGLVRSIEESGDAYMSKYLALLRSGASTAELSAFDKAFRSSCIDGSEWWFERKPRTKLAKQDVANIVARRGSSLRQKSGFLVRGGKVLLGGLTVVFVATSSDASEAIENVLPPGASIVWMTADEMVDYAFSRTRRWAENEYPYTSNKGYLGRVYKMMDEFDEQER